MSAIPDPAAHLADVLLSGWLAQPFSALLPPPLLGRLGRDVAVAILSAPDGQARLVTLLSDIQTRLRTATTLRAVLPPDVVTLLRDLLRAPYAPDRGLLLTLLLRPPFRRLNRELMLTTLMDYSRRVRSTLSDPNAGKNLGTLGRLATQAVQRSTAAIGAVAGGVASVVTDEFERQMARRASEFADGAVDEMAGRLAMMLTDPSRAHEHAEMKLSLLDFVLELRGPQLADELTRMQIPILAEKVRTAALTWLSRPQAADDLATFLTWFAAQPSGGTTWGARSVADIVGQGSAWVSIQSALRELLTHLLRPGVDSGAALQALQTT